MKALKVDVKNSPQIHLLQWALQPLHSFKKAKGFYRSPASRGQIWAKLGTQAVSTCRLYIIPGNLMKVCKENMYFIKLQSSSQKVITPLGNSYKFDINRKLWNTGACFPIWYGIMKINSHTEITRPHLCQDTGVLKSCLFSSYSVSWINWDSGNRI